MLKCDRPAALPAIAGLALIARYARRKSPGNLLDGMHTMYYDVCAMPSKPETVRLTPSESANLQQAADDAGISKSEYFRRALLHAYACRAFDPASGTPTRRRLRFWRRGG